MILSLVFSFLIGSIPVGYLLGLLRGVDVRKVGSGNTGATNVGRVLGRQVGMLTLLLDAIKGVAAALVGSRMVVVSGLDINEFASLCGLAAIVGHCYTPFLKFKGGKGVATSLGVFLAVCPVETIVAGLIFVLVLHFSNFVSLGSLVGAFSVPIIMLIDGNTGENDVRFVAAVCVALIVTLRHESNIKRLLKGKENRVYIFKRTGTTQQF